MEKNQYVTVVEDLDILRKLNFVENGFKNWELVLRSSPISKVTISVSGDYVFFKSEDPNNKRFDGADIVTLWNRDIAGPIPEEKLSALVEILKLGNVREEKES